VAPYGQITFFTTATGVNPILVSLNSAGGQNNFRNDVCAFYFSNCSAAVPGTQQTAAAPVTDALRVYVGASYGTAPGPFTVAVAAADMSSGASVWTPTSPVVLNTTSAAISPPSLAIVGAQLWVSFASPLSPFILDAATGAVLASNFTAPATAACSLLSTKYAVCGTAAPPSLGTTTVYSTASTPPSPLWSNYMAALLLAADQGADGQVVAITGFNPFALSVNGFDLATGALAWTMQSPWSGAGSTGYPLLAYDDAGTLWVAWQGYDESQQYSAVVATYDITGAAPAQVANVSVSIPYSGVDIKGLVISNNGRLGYLTLLNGASTDVVTLASAPADGGLTISGTAFSAVGAQVQTIPGPQNGQLIIGQLTTAGQPSLAVYA